MGMVEKTKAKEEMLVDAKREDASTSIDAKIDDMVNRKLQKGIDDHIDDMVDKKLGKWHESNKETSSSLKPEIKTTAGEKKLEGETQAGAAPTQTSAHRDPRATQ